MPHVNKRTAVAALPGEPHRPPPAWIKHSYRLVRYRLQPKGGHFAALQVPGLLVADLRAAAATLSS